MKQCVCVIPKTCIMQIPCPLRRGLAVAVMSFLLLVPLSASTVMISYDIILNTGEQIAESSYVQRTAAELESAIMGELFDRGYIVFNYPGKVYVTEKPDSLQVKQTIVKRSLDAADGGADLFMYLSLQFDGTREADIHLSALDYEIVRIGDSVLDHAHIRYADIPRVNGVGASHVFLDQIRKKNIF